MERPSYLFLADPGILSRFSPRTNTEVFLKIYKVGTSRLIGDVRVFIKLVGLNIDKLPDSFGGLVKTVNILEGALSFATPPKTFIAKMDLGQTFAGSIKFLN